MAKHMFFSLIREKVIHRKKERIYCPTHTHIKHAYSGEYISVVKFKR